MKLIINLLFILTLFSFSLRVDSQCTKLVKSYYNCFNLTGSGELTESFWIEALSHYPNFDAAMNFFRMIYTTINGCISSKCSCVRSGISSSYKYDPYFLKADYFEDVKVISNAVRKKHRLRTVNQVNADPQSTPFNSYTPTLNDFCLKYDWSHDSVYFYDDASSCIKNADSTGYVKCSASALQLMLNPATYLEGLEKQLKCQMDSLKCAIEIKNLYAMGELAKSTQLIKGGLYSYVRSLTGDNGAQTLCHGVMMSFSMFTFSVLAIFYF